MSLPRRLLMLVLAALPVVWGNCPYWFAGDGCGAGSAKSADAGRMAMRQRPCCRHDDATNSRGSPAPLKGDCDDCPMTVARRGSMPVPPSVELPDADPAVVSILPLFAPVSPAGTAPLEGAARPPGAPPNALLLSTVVLTV